VQDLLSSSLLSKNTKIKIYRTVILPVVLYWCETWSLTLREKHRLRVFENRVPKKDEVTGDWRRLNKEELNDLYLSPNIIQGDQIKKNEVGGACSTYGGGESCI
jgi:hypothetical protein